MKYICLLFLGFSFSVLQAQSPQYQEVLGTFKTFYNAKNPQGIFNLYDDTMQQSVSLETTSSIVMTFMDNFGAIQHFTFIEKADIVESYLVSFEKGKQKLQLVLNDTNQIIGLLFQPYDEPDKTPLFDRNTTAFELPFKGEWFTFWGGDTKDKNYHVINKSQRGAFDFIIKNKRGISYEKSGTRNEDYYAFGKPLYAVCNAVVHKVITGIRDNKPGEMNSAQPLGNAVILKTKNEEYIVYAHFEEGSITVKEGDTVAQGQKLGNCGNSGNSSEPHLHLHLQDSDNILDSNGAKTFFDSLMVNGEVKNDYSPEKGDFISPISQ